MCALISDLVVLIANTLAHLLPNVNYSCESLQYDTMQLTVYWVMFLIFSVRIQLEFREARTDFINSVVLRRLGRG